MTALVGALILAIGIPSFVRRRRYLEELRDVEPREMETALPVLNVLIAYVFPVIGIVMIIVGLIGEI